MAHGIGPATDSLLEEEILILQDFEPERSCENPRHRMNSPVHSDIGPLWFTVPSCLCAPGYRCDLVRRHRRDVFEYTRREGGVVVCGNCQVEMVPDISLERWTLV